MTALLKTKRWFKRPPKIEDTSTRQETRAIVENLALTALKFVITANIMG